MANALYDRVKQKKFENIRQEAMISMMVAAGHYRQILNDICSEYDITHDQYNILRILKGVHPDGHPRYEIIDRMIERTPDVTRLLDRLVKRGLVKRTKSEEDRRLSIAKITPKGIKLLDEMAPEFTRAAKDFTSNLPESELAKLAELSSKLYEELDE